MLQQDTEKKRKLQYMSPGQKNIAALVIFLL